MNNEEYRRMMDDCRQSLDNFFRNMAVENRINKLTKGGSKLVNQIHPEQNNNKKEFFEYHSVYLWPSTTARGYR